MRTKAQNIAKCFGNDGQNFRFGNSHLEDICDLNSETVQHDTERELTRYVFPDGSAIVVGVGAWDVEGDEPFSWEGAQ